MKKIGWWCIEKNCHFCLLLINKNVGVSSYKVSLSTKLDSPRSETTTVNKPHEKFRLLKSPAWFKGVQSNISAHKGSHTELCDKGWFGFEIEYLLMARLFRIQYQNQYLYFLAIITDTDINTAQWVIFECETPFIFSCLGPQHPCKHLIATLFNWKVSTGIGLSLF